MRSRKPCSSIQLSSRNFERYERPESGSIASTFASGPSRLATCIAAHTVVPDEPPASRPSSRASRRAVRKESRSETRTHSSTTFGSIVFGQVSLPIPSTKYGMDAALVLRGVDRALGIGADDQHVRRALLEVAADAADRAAGADRDHERVDLAARLLEDLRSSVRVVRVRVRHVRVLVGLEAARDLLGEPRADRVVRLRRVGLDGGRRDHDLGAVGAQHRDLLLAHLVGHDEDAAVALERRGDREPDARVPRGRLDDRAARLQQPVALGRLDHRQADPVLDRAAGVQVLELGEDRAGHVAGDAIEPDDRGAADELEDAWIRARHRRRRLAGKSPEIAREAERSRIAWFCSRVCGCQSGRGGRCYQACASSESLAHGDRCARLATGEPAGDVLFRPEEIHLASGEADVVPPVRRRDEAMEERVSCSRAARSQTSKLIGSPQSGQVLSTRPSVRSAARMPIASHAQLRVPVASRRRATSIRRWHRRERVRHQQLAVRVEDERVLVVQAPPDRVRTGADLVGRRRAAELDEEPVGAVADLAIALVQRRASKRSRPPRPLSGAELVAPDQRERREQARRRRSRPSPRTPTATRS